MPRDSNGNYTLPSGYLGVTGQVIQVSQHNPSLEDLAAAMTQSLPRSGVAAMTADLPMGGFKVTNVANGVAATDAATVGQTSTLAAAVISNAALKAVPVDADTLPLVDSAAGNSLKRLPWANVKAALNLLYQPLNAVLTALGGIGTAVQGDVIYGTGAGTWGRLAKGTALQVLRMNAGATAPQWATPFLQSRFDSGQQTISGAGALTLAHGLGAHPSLYIAVLQCLTTQYGYAVGEELAVNPGIGSQDVALDQGLSLSVDATNVYVKYGNEASPIRIIRKDTGNVGDITNGSWRLVVRAWA